MDVEDINAHLQKVTASEPPLELMRAQLEPARQSRANAVVSVQEAPSLCAVKQAMLLSVAARRQSSPL